METPIYQAVERKLARRRFWADMQPLLVLATVALALTAVLLLAVLGGYR